MLHFNKRQNEKFNGLPRLLSCRRGFAFAAVGGIDEVLESWSHRGFARLLGVKDLVTAWQHLAVKNGYPKN